jgi:signal transduction histidine kinase
MVEPNHDSSLVAANARLLALAVHEFRTPASVIGGYLRMLRLDDDPPPGPRQQAMIDQAERSCARVVALIAELSEIAGLDLGTATRTTMSFDLFDALSDIAASVGDRDVRLQLRGASAGAPMQGDLPRLRTAFTALFRAVMREQSGACTVIAERRLDTFTTGSTGRTATVATIVIAEEANLPQAMAVTGTAWSTGPAFDEYRGGLGLLLPIARRVIDRHGGRI